MIAPVPADEVERLAALYDLNVLDTAPEQRFDMITALVAHMFEAPIAAISLIDKDRQWVKSVFGFAVSEIPRDVSFCAHTILGTDTFVVSDARTDPRFAANSLVTKQPRLGFYAGHPLCAPNGYRVGALCVIDRVPRGFDHDHRQHLREFAAIVERELWPGTRGGPFDDIGLVATFDESPAAMAIIGFEPSRSGQLLRCSPPLSELTGFPLPELQARNLADIFHPGDAAKCLDAAVNINNGDLVRYRDDHRFVRADGTICWGQVTILAVNAARVRYVLMVVDDVTDRHTAEEHLRHLALHDALTGLPNRALLDDRLEQALVLATRNASRVAVVFVDLDHFKLVNDTFGHATGDEVLVAVAARLRDAVRDGDTVARFGGDEFVIICPGADGDSTVTAIMDRVLGSVATPISVEGTAIPVALSGGLAVGAPPATGPAQLLRDADAALYRAKTNGRNRIELAAPADPP